MMIEKTILDYLRSKTDVAVHMQRPEQLPEKYVLLEKTASQQRGHIFISMLAMQSYAPSLYEAAELDEAMRGLMATAVELNEICSVSLNSDYNFTDPKTKQYRYQAVFNIAHY